MPFTDILVLIVIFAATGAFAVRSGRRGVSGRSRFGSVWMFFYGITLTAMMAAHSVDILYDAMATRAAGDAAWTYDFHFYSMLLLAAVLIWTGAECLRAAPGVGRGSGEARKTALRGTLVTLGVVAPLIPIQMVFGSLLTTLSIVTLLVLARHPSGANDGRGMPEGPG